MGKSVLDEFLELGIVVMRVLGSGNPFDEASLREKLATVRRELEQEERSQDAELKSALDKKFPQ